MKKSIKFSVLMSVYIKEKPLHLSRAFKSICWQSVLPNEVVLVEDGHLTINLKKCIKTFQNKLNELGVPLKILKIENNSGLGNALNLGVKNCSFEYIARMDTDDLAYPSRFEKQTEYLETHNNISILGTNSIEFCEQNSSFQINQLPLSVEKVKQRISIRNPFSHPTVFLKRKDVLDAGNYQKCPYFEDYYLWIRMLENNKIGCNLKEPLLMSRANTKLYLRRGGFTYVKAISNFRRKIKKYKFINGRENLIIMLIQISIALQPNFIRRFFYSHFLRNKITELKLPQELSNEIFR